MTGASGAILGQRILENLREHEVHLILSKAALQVAGLEIGKDALFPADYRYDNSDIAAPLSSSEGSINVFPNLLSVQTCLLSVVGHQSAVRHVVSQQSVMVSAVSSTPLQKFLPVEKKFSEHFQPSMHTQEKEKWIYEKVVQ